MTTLLERPRESFDTRLQSVEHPRPRLSTIVSAATLITIAVLGILSFIRLDYSFKNIETTWGNITRFLGMATPMQWPGWEVRAQPQAGGETIYTTTWVGMEPIWHMTEVILITLALTIAGTALAVLLSIPIAYGAAANTGVMDHPGTHRSGVMDRRRNAEGRPRRSGPARKQTTYSVINQSIWSPNSPSHC